MSDPLAEAKISDGGLFLKLASDKAVKVRVLTTDPVVSMDSYGNTRYAFIVYNFTEGKAQILNKGLSIFKRIKELHTDEDYGANIKNIDLKITTTGSGKETRYTVDVLPKTETMTNEQIQEATKIDLDKVIKNGIRLSAVNAGEKVPTINADDIDINGGDDTVIEDIGDEPINLDDIPF